MGDYEIEIYSLLLTLGIAAGSIIAGRIIYIIGQKYLKRIFEKTETKLDDKLLKIISGFLNPLFLLGAVDISLYYIDFNKWNSIRTIAIKIIEIGLIIIAAFLGAKILNAIFEELPEIENRKKEEKKRNIGAIVPILKNAAAILIFLITSSMVVIKLGYSPISILTGMGIVGVAVSFAAQNTIANFLSGVFILFDGPFKIGDRIKIGEMTGEVIEIGIRNTRVQTPDNNIITIPNSNITSKEVINYNKPGTEEKVFFNVSAAYGSDTEKVKYILAGIIKETKGIMTEMPSSVFLAKLGATSLDFQAVFWIKSFVDKMEIIDTINTKVIKEFGEHGIEIPFPVYDINIRKGN